MTPKKSDYNKLNITRMNFKSMNSKSYQDQIHKRIKVRKQINWEWSSFFIFIKAYL